MDSRDFSEQEKQIGEKVDEFLEQREGLQEIEDGVEMKDGFMDLSSDTRDVTKEFRGKDSVFPEQKEKEDESPEEVIGKGPDTSIDEAASDEADDVLRVHVLERDENSVKRKYYNYHEKKDEKSKKKGGRAAVIICVTVIVLAIAALIFYLFLYLNESRTESQETTTEEAAEIYSDTITCNIADGDVCTTSVSISLESESGNKLYYILEGPGGASSDEYEEYIEEIVITVDDLTELEEEFTLKAQSLSANADVAGVLEVTFTVQMEELTAPVFSLESGDYTEASEITIEAEGGSVIYYTYDGTTPTEESDMYTGAIQMKRGNYVLSAIAVKGVRTSEVVSVIINYTPETFTYDEALSKAKAYLISAGIIADEDGNLPNNVGKMVFGSAGKIETDDSYYYVIILSRYNTGGTLLSTTYICVDDVTGDIYSADLNGSEYTIGSILQEQSGD